MTIHNQTNEFDLPVSFDDTQVAFQNKSNGELFLSYLIFSLTKNPLMVNVLSQAAKICLAAGLPVKRLIKSTVFKQFCGGESSREYRQVIATLGRSTIGAILDYSVEGNQDEAGFESTTRELLAVIQEAATNPNIPCTCMKLSAIGAFDLFEAVSAGKRLTTAEQQAWQRIETRLNTICAAAKKSQKPIYIDAEESWVQDAMDRLAETAMARYNTKRAVVYTTLQLYRWDRIDYFEGLIQKARAAGYRLGVKIVRGAYLEKERERALNMGYPSPVNPSKADTDDEYNRAINLFVDNIDVVELCLGTHNEYSCRLLMHRMNEKGVPHNHPHIWFAQLYGMSDNISFNLAKAGYNVTKYLPYGPVESTLPYLTRRAEENTAIAGQMSKELDIIVRERQRRRKGRGK
ncbi:proline dehydrogenase family protein [Desulfosarcina ovata]|uniref:Proline dehydrogenase n=1 Tax=Desulfosarcina ovata subsp. ovata TaxID=2752305 RepID=A0A5K8AF02_9BACT|nr:proline dehydrogenase family protein [Desulfosarcina ovata]BBO90510.1 proline dehydrogenase [Desulfosarcina ovata subsp. ovata]